MLYILQLQNHKYYVGYSARGDTERFDEHISGAGSAWTKKHKIVDVIYIDQQGSLADENALTLDVMDRFGWYNIRGGSWCQVDMSYPPAPLAEKKGLSIYRKKPATQPVVQQQPSTQQIVVKTEDNPTHAPIAAPVQQNSPPKETPDQNVNSSVAQGSASVAKPASPKQPLGQSVWNSAAPGSSFSVPAAQPAANGAPAVKSPEPAGPRAPAAQPAHPAASSSVVRTGVLLTETTQPPQLAASPSLTRPSIRFEAARSNSPGLGVTSGHVSKPAHQQRYPSHFGCSQGCRNKPSNSCANGLCRRCCLHIGTRNCLTHDAPAPQEPSYPYGAFFGGGFSFA